MLFLFYTPVGKVMPTATGVIHHQWSSYHSPDSNGDMKNLFRMCSQMYFFFCISLSECQIRSHQSMHKKHQMYSSSWWKSTMAAQQKQLGPHSRKIGMRYDRAVLSGPFWECSDMGPWKKSHILSLQILSKGFGPLTSNMVLFHNRA